jgi:TonB family protein
MPQRRHLIGLGLLLIICSHRLSAASPRASAEIVGEMQRAVIYSPQPEYPLEALAHRLTGNGMFLMRVHVKTGMVAEVRAVQSTGHAVLDAAAVRALRKWRFKPGALPPIGVIAPWRHDPFGKEDALMKVPISFVL